VAVLAAQLLDGHRPARRVAQHQRAGTLRLELVGGGALLAHAHIRHEQRDLRDHDAAPGARRRVEDRQRRMPRGTARDARGVHVVAQHAIERPLGDFARHLAAAREPRHHLAMHRIGTRPADAVVGVVFEQRAPSGVHIIRESGIGNRESGVRVCDSRFPIPDSRE